VSLSKSRFIAGLQCHRLLWWLVHDREAPELVPAPRTAALFRHGHTVGERARTAFPGGVLIDEPYYAVGARVEKTQRALAEGARVIYEASFIADDVFVAVDVLHRGRGGWTLTEVKSTASVKRSHVADAAVQTHVVRRAGLDVDRTEVMHLNTACRHPHLEDLFKRVDVSQAVKAELRDIPQEVRRQLRVIGQQAPPEVEPGDHCRDPYECPFIERCCEAPPDHDVSTLYKISRERAEALRAEGYATVHDLPEELELTAIADRQRRAVQSGSVVVEPGLGEALAELEGRLGFLDFETLALPIPVWPGCRPFQHVPVQLSCHVEGERGHTHHEWIADGPGDPREPLARALIDATRDATTLVAWNASFERDRIHELAATLPHLADGLEAVAARIRDLLPIVRQHVYHPDFRGSFSLKNVLPALVPELRHGALEIQEGETASAELERLMFEEVPDAERAELRRALGAYCGLDTWGLVKILERLRQMSAGS